MIRKARFVALAVAALVAAPALADKVVVMLQHTDAMSIMGQTTPAQDTTQESWFGDGAVRFDGGDTTIITRFDRKKLYFVNNGEKTYSSIDLPIDFKALVGPEMAPMMEQMAKMMAASVVVTPSDKTGKFAGIACQYKNIEISMGMMKMSILGCYSDSVGIDYGRYREFAAAQADLMPNSGWMKELADKVRGYPVQTETTTAMMGKEFKSWQELKAVEDRTPPPGHYDPPAGYREVKYDPMAQAARKGKH
ncbi:MAG: DUF4412 domain-containing protein [Holophagales bacterium]|nr:MAG: DUF4412 domain-containing protein [Holophagales bacterium]